MQAAIMWPLLSLFQLLTVFPAYHFNEHPESQNFTQPFWQQVSRKERVGGVGIWQSS